MCQKIIPVDDKVSSNCTKLIFEMVHFESFEHLETQLFFFFFRHFDPEGLLQ